MIVGLISDTHGLLRREAVKALQGCAHIIHAGDVGREDVLDALNKIAPVTIVRGNVDMDEFGQRLPLSATYQLGQHNIFVLHILQDLEKTPKLDDCDTVIYGHSHKPFIETRNGVLYINPGSAGPKRFSLPVTVGFLTLSPDGILDAQIEELKV